MQIAKRNELIFIRMDDGEDFFENLNSALKKYDITSAVVLGGIGMLRDFEIGWFNIEKKEYEKEKISVPHELLAIQGNISLLENGTPFAHLHVSLAGPSRSVVGGHLFSGKVCNTVEMFLMEIKFSLKRKGAGTFKKLEAEL